MIVLGSLRRRVRDVHKVEFPRSGASGQTLVLFALMLVVLLGFAALAIDVTRVYADLRFYRATADAAALAGAQDLQGNNTRVVGAADYARARGHALATLEEQLGGTADPACASTSSNIVDCALNAVDPTNPYRVSIRTDPSPSCATCNPARAVQVTVRRPVYPLTFAGIPPFDQTDWNVQATSVAGLQYGRSYAIITLRPPKPNGNTFAINDIELDGGTVVTVDDGDVGSNANMTYSGCLGSGTRLDIDDDYGMYYWDPTGSFGTDWGTVCEPQPPTPTVQPLPAPIEDPNYVPWGVDMTSAPGLTNDSRTNALDDLACQTTAQAVPAVYSMVTDTLATDPAKVVCYEPGVYQRSGGTWGIDLGEGEVAILTTNSSGVGAYYIPGGLRMAQHSHLIGGYTPGQPGVVLKFDESGPGNCSNCIFQGTAADTISLNAGTRFPGTATSGSAASATFDWGGNKIETTGASSPSPPLVITLVVTKDPNCVVPTSGPFEEPPACLANKNKAMNIAGNGNLVLEGVQYMPTDNVEISGNSSGTGRVGQIISWTLKYSGGVQINQEGPGGEGPGILRIDAACSPSMFCNNP